MAAVWPPPLTPIVLHDGTNNYSTKALAAVEDTLNVRVPEDYVSGMYPGSTLLLRWSTYVGMLQRECSIQSMSATKIVLYSDVKPTSIQRRQFFRGQVITKTFIANWPIEEGCEDIMGQSVDISEGGILVSITKPVEFEENQEVTLRFVIDTVPLYITAQFLRCEDAYRGIRASFKFLNASADVMTTIRKCVFESQLDKRS